MYCNSKKMPVAFLLLAPFLSHGISVRAQNSVSNGQPRATVTILDSNKEQDGLAGSVRRVTIQTAKLEVKQGRVVEGPRQVLEVTTYGITGNRIDNISYPVADSLVGKEEYKYDDKGNIIEMTLRDNRGSILNREAYDYEFDRFGNWTKMVTSLVVFEAGEVKHEAVEVTYRTIAYYFDDSIAKIVDASLPLAKPVQSPLSTIASVEKDTSELTNHDVSRSSSLNRDNPPPENSKPETKNTSAPIATEANREKEIAGRQTNAFAVLTKPANAGVPEAEKTSAPARNEPEGVATGSNEGAKAIAAVVGTANSPAPSGSSAETRENTPSTEISKPETKNTPAPIATEADREKEIAGRQTDAFAVLTKPANAGAPEAEKTSAPERNEPEGVATGSNGGAKPIAAVVGAVNSVGSSTETHDQTSALEYYKTGRFLFEAGGVNAAVKAYQLSLALNPNSAEVHLSLAHAYLKLKKDNDAVKAFKESIRINPDAPEAHYGLGLAYFRMGRNKDALNAFKKATVLQPGMAKAHYGLALAYQELGRQDELMEEYKVLEGLDRSLAKQLSQTFPAFNLPCSVQCK